MPPVTIDGTSGITTPMYNGAITANAVTPSVNMKSRIINGAMVINQRGFSGSNSNNTYTLDRWMMVTDLDNKFTLSQNAGSVTPPVGFVNYLGVTSSSSYSVPSSGYYFLEQSIEGLNIGDLGWGTANAKTVTLSFQVYSSLTGTFGGALRNSSGGRSYPFSYTVSSANTWTSISVTVAGDTTGTWLTTNGIGIRVNFSLGTGSTYSGTANAWNSNNNFAPTGAVSVVGTNGATFYLTGVQLEVGSTATSFDYRPYGTELALCQRYYYVMVSGAGSYFSNAFYYTSSHLISAINYPVAMRTDPTLVSTTGTNFYQFYRNGSNDTLNSLTLSSSGLRSGSLQNTTDVSGTAGQAGALYADNASCLIAFQAEL